MAYNIVPLTTGPNQSMKITLPIDSVNVTLKLTVRYNLQANYWVMTIADSSGNTLVDSLPMVPGEYPAADLLGQYGYLGIGSAYIVNASNKEYDIPDNTNLGTDYLLLWGDRV